MLPDQSLGTKKSESRAAEGKQRPIHLSDGGMYMSEAGFNTISLALRCRLHLKLAWGYPRFEDGFPSSPNSSVRPLSTEADVLIINKRTGSTAGRLRRSGADSSPMSETVSPPSRLPVR